jgi:enoyl-CoA hydratase
MIEDVYNGDSDEMNNLLFSAREIINAHLSMDKPIISAINGHAMGAGAAFGLLCDFVILEEHALIADGHIRAALAAGDGGAIIWPLAMGITKAKRYLLTGDWITAVDAERFGLVTEVVPRGTSLERAQAIARRLADGPQSAIRYTKQALQSWLKIGLAGGFEQSLALEGLTMKLDDVPRALKSLRETNQGAIAPEDPR